MTPDDRGSGRPAGSRRATAATSASRRRGLLFASMGIALAALARPVGARARRDRVSPPEEFFRNLRYLQIGPSFTLLTDEGSRTLGPRSIDLPQAQPGGLIRNDLQVVADARMPAVAARLVSEKITERRRLGRSTEVPVINQLLLPPGAQEEQLSLTAVVDVRDASGDLGFAPPDGIAVLGIMEWVSAWRYSVSREGWVSPRFLTVTSVPRHEVNDFLLRWSDALIEEALANWVWARDRG